MAKHPSGQRHPKGKKLPFLAGSQQGIEPLQQGLQPGETMNGITAMVEDGAQEDRHDVGRVEGGIEELR